MKFSWNYCGYGRSLLVNILVSLIAIIFILGACFGFMCLNSWLIMLLWNAVLPVAFGFSTLTFWQTFGLYLIIWLLNGGIARTFKIFTPTN